jgi:hypothetical protein
MNKEPQTVNWSKQKPGTIGVTRHGNHQFEFVASRINGAVFHNEHKGWETRSVFGRKWLDKDMPDDILLPWEYCLAEGHNPDGLTNVQVGDGFRLQNLGEMAASDGQHWRGEWVNNGPHFQREITNAHCSHRVPITKPKRRISCGPEHFPPGTVFRVACHDLTSWEAIHGVNARGIVRGGVFVTYEDLKGLERSTDFGKTWLPCYVETEE